MSLLRVRVYVRRYACWKGLLDLKLPGMIERPAAGTPAVLSVYLDNYGGVISSILIVVEDH